MNVKVLVIDDDLPSCRLAKAIFDTEGFDVAAAHDGQSGLSHALSEAPDVVLLDMGLPDMNGLEVLEVLGQKMPDLPIIMLTANRELKTAVRATQLGAYDYLTKPIAHDELVMVVRRALETRALRVEVKDLRRQLGRDDSLVTQMGPSALVKDVVEQVGTVAASRFTVLVLGETGTGKELVAQAVHRRSDRRDRPFVALDCGAIPESLLESELFGYEKGSFTGADKKRQGRFQLAEKGTMFLDEVGNLPMNLQAKLLRVLESQQVLSLGAARATALDVRFIAATNDDLQARVTEGQFRADLYFRLAQYTLRLPALRDRLGDIPHLATRFAEEASVELRRPIKEIHADAIALLQRQSWPGNVRELRNIVRQAVIGTKDLIVRKETFRALLTKTESTTGRPSQKAVRGASLKEIAALAAQDAERDAICETLRSTHGNKSQAARELRTDYKTLHVKMKSLGIRARDYQT